MVWWGSRHVLFSKHWGRGRAVRGGYFKLVFLECSVSFKTLNKSCHMTA